MGWDKVTQRKKYMCYFPAQEWTIHKKWQIWKDFHILRIPGMLLARDATAVAEFGRGMVKTKYSHKLIL